LPISSRQIEESISNFYCMPMPMADDADLADGGGRLPSNP
jgi:hypothetical protein